MKIVHRLLTHGPVCIMVIGLAGSRYCIEAQTMSLTREYVRAGGRVIAVENVAPGAGVASATLSPSTGSGSTQTFSFTFTDPAGFADISGASIVIGSVLSYVNSCSIGFGRPNTVSLMTDSGSGNTSTTLGFPIVLQNSQCVILASETSQTASGNTIIFTVTVVFKSAFSGPKTIWASFNNNVGTWLTTPQWTQVGTYTALAPTQALSALSASPAAGTGQAQLFTFAYFDPMGAPDISGGQMVFNTSLTGVNGCWITFDATNNLSLGNDAGTTFTTAKFGQQTVLQNSQCILYAGNSYQAQSGQNLSVTVFVAFKTGFAGTKNMYASVTNNAGGSFIPPVLGTWTVPAYAAPLAAALVDPAAGSGPSVALTFVYSDPNGYADIANTVMIVNGTQSTVNSCAIQLTRSTGLLALTADSGSGTTTATLGNATVLQNSQCIVNAASSIQFGFGNYHVVTLFVTMKTSATQNLYASVTNNIAQTSAMTALGTWSVTSPPVLTPVSVVPLTGAAPAGTYQNFTFTMSDPAGANDISGALLVLNSSLTGVNSCYILYNAGGNFVSLASNDATQFPSATLQTASVLSNSQCSLDASKSFAVKTGKTITLTIAAQFTTLVRGQLYSFLNAETNTGVYSNWFLESRFTVQ